MIVAGQRVESLNCGWVVALEDSVVARGHRVAVRFEGTGNVKAVLSDAYVTGNVRDTNRQIAEGEILRSTRDGDFEITKIKSARDVTVKFLATGNIVGQFQKDAVICGYVRDKGKIEDAEHEAYMEAQEREAARYAAEQKRAKEMEEAQERKALRAAKKLEQEKYTAESAANKVARDVELRANAVKAVMVLDESAIKGENPNDINIDFKDRNGKWVLHFGWKDEFYHTRLGRYHNNMTQRAGKNSHYSDVAVSEDFLDPQKFCDWAVQQPGWGKGYCLEKDLLVPGNRCYSADTCCFVPHAINTSIIRKTGKTVATEKSDGWHVKFMKNHLNIFLGVYPSHCEALRAYHKYREDYAKKLAVFFQNKISERAYEALLSWKAQ